MDIGSAVRRSSILHPGETQLKRYWQVSRIHGVLSRPYHLPQVPISRNSHRLKTLYYHTVYCCRCPRHIVYSLYFSTSNVCLADRFGQGHGIPLIIDCELSFVHSFSSSRSMSNRLAVFQPSLFPQDFELRVGSIPYTYGRR